MSFVNSFQPPTYLDELPDPYWFWTEFGMSHEAAYDAWKLQFLKRKLSEQQNHRCCYCGRQTRMDVPISHPLLATFEHVQRRADNGSDDESNLVIACRECNGLRGTTSAYDYLGYLYLPAKVRIFA